MAGTLGLSIGSVSSVAVAHSGDTDALDPAGSSILSRRSTLLLAPGQDPVLGATAAEHNGTLVSDFATRVGDPVGLVADDGSLYAGEDLVATAMHCLIAATDHEFSTPPAVAATYPTVWRSYTVDVLREALREVGLDKIDLVSEADAALAWLRAAYPDLDDDLVVVYDLGGSTLDIALAQSGTAVANPVRSEDFGGEQFDHLALAFVLENVTAQFGSIDITGSAMVEGLAHLRAQCTTAKEELSAKTETVIAVRLPGVHADVRLVRSELEELIRGPLAASLELVRETLRSSGFDPSDVSAVLLTGGSSAIPMVAELMSSELQLRVVTSGEPQHTVALGAAILAAQSAASAANVAATAADDATAADVLASEPVPAVHAGAVTVLAPKPRPKPQPEKTGLTWSRKAVFASAAAATLMVLAAGGLAAGTGVFSDSPAKTNESVQTVPAGESTTGAPGTNNVESNGANSTVAVGGSTNPDGTSNTNISRSGQSSPGSTGGSGLTGGAAPAPAAGTVPAANQPAAANVPAGSAPAQDPAPAPAPAPAPPASEPPTNQPPAFEPAPPQFPEAPDFIPEVPIIPGVVGRLGNTAGGAADTVGDTAGGAADTVGGAADTVVSFPGQVLGQ